MCSTTGQLAATSGPAWVDYILRGGSTSGAYNVTHVRLVRLTHSDFPPTLFSYEIIPGDCSLVLNLDITDDIPGRRVCVGRDMWLDDVDTADECAMPDCDDVDDGVIVQALGIGMEVGELAVLLRKH